MKSLEHDRLLFVALVNYVVKTVRGIAGLYN